VVDRESGDRAAEQAGIQFDVPRMWRIWNYWIGGKDNYPVDRVAGDAVIEVYPDIRRAALAYQSYLVRVVRFLVTEANVAQFLVIGTGFPAVQNMHEVAQSIVPAARVVYVDDDPSVLAHGRALLTSTTPDGVSICLDASMRDPTIYLADAREVLNFNDPVATIFMSMLGNVKDLDEARSIVGQVVAALSSGSYLAMGDFADTNDGVRAAAKQYGKLSSQPYQLRTTEQLASLLTGLKLIEPGLVPVDRWHPDPVDVGEPDPVDIWGAVGRKP
jgi:S-adenosyl methyltransferase